MREVNMRSVESDLVDDLFPSRWSPRSFNEERIDDDAFTSLIEAARWAPSSRNMQPWRFVFAARDDPEWSGFLGVLDESNREWAHRASHLIIVIASADDTVVRPGVAFDTGAAWMSLALQAQLSGLVTHPMGGFDTDAARGVANIPEGFAPIAMVAVGVRGAIEDLPEHRRASESSRSQRKPIGEIASRGSFPERWT
ncbi:MAG: nitroreductase family protein [Candidatus Woesearchaeota archaeon]